MPRGPMEMRLCYCAIEVNRDSLQVHGRRKGSETSREFKMKESKCLKDGSYNLQFVGTCYLDRKLRLATVIGHCVASGRCDTSIDNVLQQHLPGPM